MSEKTVKKILVYIGICFLLLFALLPVVWMLWISFVTKPDFLFTGETTYSLDNYTNILTSKSLHFIDYVKNSLIISIVTAGIVTFLSSCAGYAVSRMRFPGKIAVPLFILALSMFPPISIVGYLYRFFATMGMLNTHSALILPYIALAVPLSLWIIISYFSQIPRDLDNAGLVDGAGRLGVLFKIILPIALPGIFSAFLLVFIASFNEFLFALMLTVDFKAQTIPVGIALFEGLHGEIPWGNIMAASAVASIPLIVLTLIFQKYVIQGLMAGSVRG